MGTGKGLMTQKTKSNKFQELENVSRLEAGRTQNTVLNKVPTRLLPSCSPQPNP